MSRISVKLGPGAALKGVIGAQKAAGSGAVQVAEVTGTSAAWAENRPAAGTAHALPARLFPTDNWWNTNIAAAPTDHNQTSYLNGMDFTLLPTLGNNYGYPFCTVSGNYPKVKFAIWDYVVDGGTDGEYPIPIPALTEYGWTETVSGNPGPPLTVNPKTDGWDHHLMIVDIDNNWLYEIYQPYYNDTANPVSWAGDYVQPGEYACTAACYWDMDTNDQRTDGVTSADAAGMQVLPGCIQYDEVMSGDPITHAHGFCVNFGHDGSLDPIYVWPARHAAASYSATHPPFGARIRLKSTYDITRGGQNTAAAQRLLQSFKNYGLYMIDNSNNGEVIGTNDDRWGDYDEEPRVGILGAVGALNVKNDFELVELGYGAP